MKTYGSKAAQLSRDFNCILSANAVEAIGLGL